MRVDSTSPVSPGPAVPPPSARRWTSVARTAEAIGVRTLSVMDHWFQMDRIWPAEEPMLEGYTTLGFVAARPNGSASACSSAASRTATRACWPRR